MRHGLIAVVAIIAGLIFAAGTSNAALATVLTAPAATARGSLVQEVQIFPRRYYRQYPYGAPPVVVVPPAVPSWPCRRQWSRSRSLWCRRPVRRAAANIAIGTARHRVDARYNRPYLGPRP